MIPLYQTSYIEKILKKFVMQNSKKRGQHFRTRITFLLDNCLRTSKEKNYMEKVPYASVVRIFMYVILCTRPDIYYAIGIVSRYQTNPKPNHWVVVKHILKYHMRMRDYMLVYYGDDL